MSSNRVSSVAKRGPSYRPSRARAQYKKPQKNSTLPSFANEICSVVDKSPGLTGAGIVLEFQNGKTAQLRAPTNDMFLVIRPKKNLQQEQKKAVDSGEAGFWDRWGPSVMSCSGTVLTGAVIYFSGGTATPFVSTAALSSSALCGTSIGKAIEYDAWQKMKANQGSLYRTWMKVETVLTLIDLCGGIKGASKVFTKIQELGEVDKFKKSIVALQKSLGDGKKLTRRQLLEAIKKVDPSIDVDKLRKLKGANYVSKSAIVSKGTRLVANAKQINFSRQQMLLIAGLLADAYSIKSSSFTENCFEIILFYNEK